MNIQAELQRMPLPNTYSREGKTCFFDPYRQKLIERTPEEIVRQKVAKFCEARMGVPAEMIRVEEPISHYVDGIAGRADIVIHKTAESGDSCLVLEPVAVIECKNESVVLTDQVFDQAMRYCDDIGAKYAVITNGREMSMAVYQESDDAYHVLEEILDYSTMLGGTYRIPEMPQPASRFSLKQLSDVSLMDEYNSQSYAVFGFDTPDCLKGPVVNIAQGLFDLTHRLPPVKTDGFEMVEDIGIRFLDYSNAGSGHYIGDYRSFLIRDRENEAQIVSIALFGTDPTFRGENRGSYTSLVIAVDRFKTSHNSLQYNIDRFSTLTGNELLLNHNGRISNYKSADVIDYVSCHGKNVCVVNGRIALGSFPVNRLVCLDDPQVAKTLYALIEYALLREEMRRKHPNNDHS